MSDTFIATYINEDFSIEYFNHINWKKSQPVQIGKYWSGENAPIERQAEACALWSDEFLYVRFVCNQDEPLIIAENPQTKNKTMGLWERDVCEIFIAPNVDEENHYFEFEAAPTGEWLDLEIRQHFEQRETNWDYKSEMKASGKIEDKKVMMIIRIPFSALSAKPNPKENWRVNLFRCVGIGETRGYLAWQPTKTETPNFHIPDVFGWLRFQ